MPKTRPPSAPAFRQRMVDLVRSGRDPADLSREFEPSAQAIWNWVAEADRRDGRREPKPVAADAVLTSAERDELARLRRENKQLRVGRDILSRAAAWFARRPGLRGRPGQCRPALRVHEREPGRLPRGRDGPRPRRVQGGVPRVA